MKKYVLCKKIADDSYAPIDSNDESMVTLFIFLTDAMDLNRILSRFIDFNEDETGTNICRLKKKGDFIEISLDTNIFEGEAALTLSLENFSEVIDQWQKLYHEGWKEIIINQDDSGVHLEGRNN